MAETIIAKLLVRQGSIQDLPMLAAGEFGLAQDEQRLFIGQTPKTGTLVSATVNSATVKFSNSFNDQADQYVIDLDTAYNRSYQIDVYDSVTNQQIPSILGTDISSNDGENTFDPGLSRALTTADTITLRHNKEITNYKSDDQIIGGVESIYLDPVSSPGTPENTNPRIDFNSEIKNSITFEYMLTLGTNTTSIRKGTLSISVYGDATSNIDDNFTSTADLANVKFSIHGVTPKHFNLQYDTTNIEQMQFSYTQKSFKQNPVIN